MLNEGKLREFKQLPEIHTTDMLLRKYWKTYNFLRRWSYIPKRPGFPHQILILSYVSKELENFLKYISMRLKF